MIENVENLTGGIDTTEALEGEVTLGSGGTATTNHNELTNLDFENSGHTGFQPAGDYVEDINYVHTDNNYTNEDKVKVDILETTGDGNMFLTNDGTYKDGGSGGITQETDPTVPQYVKDITEEDINSWNNKSEFSGSYNDLMDTPTIPTIENQYTNEDKAKVDLIDNTGDGSMYLSNDGTYKEVASGGSEEPMILDFTGLASNFYTQNTNVTITDETLLAQLNVIKEQLNSGVIPIVYFKMRANASNTVGSSIRGTYTGLMKFYKYGNDNWVAYADVELGKAASGSNLVIVTTRSITLGSSITTKYVDNIYARQTDVLTKNNTTSFTPNSNYHPATKKYVDDLITKLKTDNNLV